jgi:hypothetical protein
MALYIPFPAQVQAIFVKLTARRRSFPARKSRYSGPSTLPEYYVDRPSGIVLPKSPPDFPFSAICVA